MLKSFRGPFYRAFTAMLLRRVRDDSRGNNLTDEIGEDFAIDEAVGCL